MEAPVRRIVRHPVRASLACLVSLAALGGQTKGQDYVFDLEPGGKAKEQKWPERLPFGALLHQANERFAGIEGEISIEAASDRDSDKASRRGPKPELRAAPCTGGIRFSLPSGARGGEVYTVSYTAKFEVFFWQQVGRRGNWVRSHTSTKALTTKVIVTLPRELPVDLPESGETTLKLPPSVRILRATPSMKKRLTATIDADGASVHLRATGEGTPSVSLKYELDGRSYFTKVTLARPKNKEAAGAKKQGGKKDASRRDGPGAKAS
jgi:hypothetical protein